MHADDGDDRDRRRDDEQHGTKPSHHDIEHQIARQPARVDVRLRVRVPLSLATATFSCRGMAQHGAVQHGAGRAGLGRGDVTVPEVWVRGGAVRGGIAAELEIQYWRQHEADRARRQGDTQDQPHRIRYKPLVRA